MQTGRTATSIAGFAAAYLLVIAVAVGLTRFEGGVALVWLASAVLTARLIAAPKQLWPVYMASAGVISTMVTGLLGLGWQVAVPLSAVNVFEAWFAAEWLVRRAPKDRDDLAWLWHFLLVSGFVSPFACALPGAALTHLATGTDWLRNAVNWIVGHGLGNIIFTPIALALFDGQVVRWRNDRDRATVTRFVLLLGFSLVAVVATFGQDRLPLLFVPILALVVVTYMFGRAGALLGVLVLMGVGGALTVAGHGPVALAHIGFVARVQFFQAYLAVTVLTLLPVAADLSARKRLLCELEESEARFRLLADHATDVTVKLDVQGVMLFASPAIEHFLGISPTDAVGRSPLDFIATEYHADVRAAHFKMLGGGGNPARVEYQARDRDGRLRWFETNGRAVLAATGIPTGVIASIREIGERKSLEARLTYAATIDPLTGLANRREFQRVLGACVGREPGGCVAVFDLDHFKSINDRFGHDTGDRVLFRFAQTAQGIVRGTDTVARLGGEEFAVILPGATLAQAETICTRILEAFSQGMVRSDVHKVRATASAGIAMFATNEDDTLRRADKALYAAKHAGRDQVSIAA